MESSEKENDLFVSIEMYSVAAGIRKETAADLLESSKIRGKFIDGRWMVNKEELKKDIQQLLQTAGKKRSFNVWDYALLVPLIITVVAVIGLESSETSISKKNNTIATPKGIDYSSPAIKEKLLSSFHQGCYSGCLQTDGHAPYCLDFCNCQNKTLTGQYPMKKLAEIVHGANRGTSSAMRILEGVWASCKQSASLRHPLY